MDHCRKVNNFFQNHFKKESRIATCSAYNFKKTANRSETSGTYFSGLPSSTGEKTTLEKQSSQLYFISAPTQNVSRECEASVTSRWTWDLFENSTRISEGWIEATGLDLCYNLKTATLIVWHKGPVTMRGEAEKSKRTESIFSGGISSGKDKKHLFIVGENHIETSLEPRSFGNPPYDSRRRRRDGCPDRYGFPIDNLHGKR